MQDHELYRRIWGIESPWKVERVELKLESGEVYVYLDQGRVLYVAEERKQSRLDGF